ncbi:putative NUDIX hydrolase [compost metagenome]
MTLHEHLSQKMKARDSQNITLEFVDYACVAVILRGDSWDNLEVGFIERATHPSDRWSGQLAFPGGRKEQSDFNDLAAALRETLEEVGIDLKKAELLGRLHDIQARRMDMMLEFFIRPFVFYTDRNFIIKLDSTEVADFFWAPLKHLTDPQRQTTMDVTRNSVQLSLPAVKLDKGPVLWGLTYMMTQDLLQTLRPNPN